MKTDSSEKFQIRWNGKEITVLFTSYAMTDTYKISAYEDENMTIRVWDGRVNQYYQSHRELVNRLNQLTKKRIV